MKLALIAVLLSASLPAQSPTPVPVTTTVPGALGMTTSSGTIQLTKGTPAANVTEDLTIKEAMLLTELNSSLYSGSPVLPLAGDIVAAAHGLAVGGSYTITTTSGTVLMFEGGNHVVPVDWFKVDVENFTSPDIITIAVPATQNVINMRWGSGTTWQTHTFPAGTNIVLRSVNGVLSPFGTVDPTPGVQKELDLQGTILPSYITVTKGQ